SAPLRHRAADHQRPFVWDVDGLDQRLHVAVPTGKVVGELAPRTRNHPRLHLPIVTLNHADEVHELCAPDWIMQNEAARPEPGRTDQTVEMLRQAFHRDETAPCDAPGELRLAETEQDRAHCGVD